MKQLLAFLLFSMLFACNKGEDKMPLASKLEAASLKSSERYYSNRDEAEVSANAAPASEEMAMAPPPPTDPFQIEQKIIKNAALRFETPDMDETYKQVLSAVKSHGAMVQSDVEGKDYESIFRNMTIRLPSKNFDAFLTDAGKGVSYFDRKEISSEDVTEEFVDVDARLKAKKTLEARYLELLKKANKVSEMLEIERELANVREEIEAKEGRLKFLENHVSMSTVTIEFYKKTAVEGGVTVSYGSKIWNAIASGFNGISVFFIELLYIWPLIIILVVLFFWLRRKIRRKKTQ
jgi:hypothetical protein